MLFNYSDKSVRVFQVLEENNNLEERTFSPLEGHTYAINHVEFSKDGSMLASCSLDGCTIVWNSAVSLNINISIISFTIIVSFFFF